MRTFNAMLNNVDNNHLANSNASHSDNKINNDDKEMVYKTSNAVKS